MRLAMLFAAVALASSASAAQAASLEVREAAARLVVIPEDRSDLQVEILTRNPNLPLEVRAGAERTVIDGNLANRLRACRTIGGRALVEVAGVGEIPYEDLPQVVVRTPRDVRLAVGGAVFGKVGRTNSLELGNAGCGDWTVANVAGRLRLSLAGSGGARTGEAGEAVLRVAGSGDVAAQAIRGPLTVDLAGSGDVEVASVAGPLEVKIAGSGDVRVGQGRASAMTATIAGSGDVDFGGTADRLDARIAGSGDVRVRQVAGPVNKRVLGSGQVTVGR